ncbi:MAG TPA: Stp1/IreP family PP2C-type Ser/Thr phosphatase [Solirubrobacteraceae bacterium]|jgi:protein phosphatase
MLRVAEQYTGTDTGLQRRANEDSMFARSPLFVVADGMGGAQAGEVASRIAVESFHDGIEDPTRPEEHLAANALAANARIHELSQNNAEHAGMGTTLTAVYVGEEEVSIAHVGDSRAYCMRDGELLRLTDDHSLVDELIREGRLTPEEAEEHPQRSIITRALGPEETVEVDTRSFRARAGDVYLLCSDGLTSMVSEPRLTEILVAHSRLHDAGEALIAEANRAGGRDNITVILLRLEEVGGDRIAASEETGRFDVDAEPPDGENGALGERYTTIVHAPPVDRAPSAAGDGLADRPVAARRPRRPSSSEVQPRRRRRRRVVLPAVVLVVLAALGMSAYLVSQSVYFIGTDSDGLVSVFQGFPFELPGGIKLYRTYYVSGVSASTLSGGRRSALLDHELRSEAKAGSLIHSLEREELSE